jgi:hypothetical protein
MSSTSYHTRTGLWWLLTTNVFPVVEKTSGIESKYAEMRDGLFLNTQNKRKLEEGGYVVKSVAEFTPQIYGRQQMEFTLLAAEKKRRQLTDEFNRFYSRYAGSKGAFSPFRKNYRQGIYGDPIGSDF